MDIIRTVITKKIPEGVFLRHLPSGFSIIKHVTSHTDNPIHKKTIWRENYTRNMGIISTVNQSNSQPII
jgi:hypothetical protein